MQNIYRSAKGERLVRERYLKFLARWPIANQQIRVPTSQGETFVVACGPEGAPSLVLLHGGGLNSAMWMGSVSAFAEGFRVFAIDLIGEAGLSAPSRPPLTSDAHTLWLDDVFLALSVTRVSLYGASLGGWLALDYATRRPDRVDRVAVLCPGGIGRQNLMFATLTLGMFGKWGKRKLMERILGRPSAGPSVGLPTFGNFVALIYEHFRLRLAKMPTFSDKALKRLQMPVLAIVGGRDVLLDSITTKLRLERHLPHVEIVCLPEAGHLITRQTQRVLEFLSSEFAPRLKNKNSEGLAPDSLSTPQQCYFGKLRSMNRSSVFATHKAKSYPGRLFRAKSVSIQIPTNIANLVEAALQIHPVSPVAVYLAAWRCFLFAMTKRQSIPMVMPLDGGVSGQEKRINFSVNLVPFEAGIASSDDFETILRATFDELAILKELASGPAFSDLLPDQHLQSEATTYFVPEISFSSWHFAEFPLVSGQRSILSVIPVENAYTDVEIRAWIDFIPALQSQNIFLTYNSERFTQPSAEMFLDTYLEVTEKLLSNMRIPVAEALDSTPPPPSFDQWRLRSIRLLSTFGDDPVSREIESWADRLDMAYVVESAGYGQILQELANPLSATRLNREGATLIFLRLEDLLRERTDRASLLDDAARLTELLLAQIDEYVSALKSAAAERDVSFIVTLCPPSVQFTENSALRKGLSEVEEHVLTELARVPGLVVQHAQTAAAAFGRVEWNEPEADRLAHLPYTETGNALLAAIAMRRLHEELRRPFKVIVVDCDNVLWNGALAEVGPDGLQLTDGHLLLQRRLVQAAERGLLVCLCSANIASDVDAVFQRRKDMILQAAHIVSRRINWLPRSHNLIDLAGELGLDLDSFVLLAENPVEVEEIRSALPMVVAIKAPSNPMDLGRFSQHLWPLDCSRATRESGGQTAMCKEESAWVAVNGESARLFQPTHMGSVSGQTWEIIAGGLNGPPVLGSTEYSASPQADKAAEMQSCS